MNREHYEVTNRILRKASGIGVRAAVEEAFEQGLRFRLRNIPHPMGMTAKQRALFEFITDYSEAHGICPSFEEMKDHLGLRSKSGVHRMVVALEERGLIIRMPNRARAIGLVEREP